MIIIAALINYYPVDMGWFGINDICKYLFYCVLGMILEPFINENKVKRCIGNWRTIVAITLFAVITYIFNEEKTVNRVHIIFMIMLILSVSIILERFDLRFLDSIGKYNLTIYIYSWPVQAVIELASLHLINVNINYIILIKMVFGLCAPMTMVWIVDRILWLKKIRKYIAI